MPRPIIAVSIVLAAAATAAGQFRTAVDVVRVEALVADDGRPIAGLSAADFRLTDDGVEQAITVRPLAGTDIDVVVALDTSASAGRVWSTCATQPPRCSAVSPRTTAPR